ncbi:MAG: class I SAM-dependent methyltransferase [Acidimicrobiia bacterium]|nr:class I SAM-dependent methyltransferase [Acidimicrobiia bacterium]
MPPDTVPDASPTNRWRSADLALAYLAEADAVPRRTEGEATLVEVLPQRCDRILDLGCGGGRLSRIVLADRPHATGLAVDFSPTMLATARAELTGTGVLVAEHDLAEPLASGRVGEAVATQGRFDAVVSSFAIHHLPDSRKRCLYSEILAVLRPGGVFANLEHVASATRRHEEVFWSLVGEAREQDPSNILAPVDVQLGWLRELGYVEVDALWRWRELALLVGEHPAD